MEDPLERLEPDETERAGEELLDPELERVTLAGLLDLLPLEDVERVTDELLLRLLDLDLDTFGLLLERFPREDRDLYTEPDDTFFVVEFFRVVL